MKKIFYIQIITLVIGLILIISFNYYIDPARKFKNDFEEIDMSKNILVTRNIDERIFKKSLIEKKENIEILILGSSRIMGIGKDELNTKKEVFNAGVSGANLKDIFALTYVANQKGIKKIIVGVDPWIFNKDEDKRYKSIEENFINEYNVLFSKNLKIEKDKFFTIKYLLKFSTLKDALKILKRGNIRKKAILLSERDNSEKYNIFLSKDASLIYSNKFKRENINDWEANIGYQMKNFTNLDKERKELFETFMNYYKDKNIEIILFLPPYNPNYYKYTQKEMKNYYNIMEEVKKYIVDFSEKNNIKLIGDYYIKELEEESFYDTMHLRRENFKKFNF